MNVSYECDLTVGDDDEAASTGSGDGAPHTGERSSVDEVYTQILLRIVRGEFPSGAALTSTRLAAQLNVSRTPIIAALDRLAADGILKKERNRRAVVREGAGHWLSQVHQLREILEPQAAALAAKHISDEALVELEQLRLLVIPHESDDWMVAARRFDQAIHLSIAEFCGNLPLRKTIYKCWSYKRLVFDAGHNEPSAVETGYREHVAILQALARHDSETASAAMLFHLRSAACLRADMGIA